MIVDVFCSCLVGRKRPPRCHDPQPSAIHNDPALQGSIGSLFEFHLAFPKALGHILLLHFHCPGRPVVRCVEELTIDGGPTIPFHLKWTGRHRHERIRVGGRGSGSMWRVLWFAGSSVLLHGRRIVRMTMLCGTSPSRPAGLPGRCPN